jgi:hypothetical protein
VAKLIEAAKGNLCGHRDATHAPCGVSAWAPGF